MSSIESEQNKTITVISYELKELNQAVRTITVYNGHDRNLFI